VAGQKRRASWQQTTEEKEIQSIQFRSQHPATSSLPTAKTIKGGPKSIEGNGLLRSSAPFAHRLVAVEATQLEKWWPMNLLRSISIGYASRLWWSETVILAAFTWQQLSLAKRPARIVTRPISARSLEQKIRQSYSPI
jgi:hypothetical protein